MSNQGLIVAISILFIVSCKAPQTTGVDKSAITTKTSDYYHPIDDSTLTNSNLPVIMPYNRIIDPAGTSISYGDPELENHSLDGLFIDGTDFLVVEDRYGIVVVNVNTKEILGKWSFNDDKVYSGLMSTYSGLQILKTGNDAEIFWSASGKGKSLVMRANWDGKKLTIGKPIEFKPLKPAPLALPNELALHKEKEKDYLFVVLNGNNQLVKIDLSNDAVVWESPTGVAPYGVVIANNKVFVTNWAGPLPVAGNEKETAGVPYGEAYIDPKTGATAMGTVSVFDSETGKALSEINVGLHPNDIIASPDKHYIYVSNGNSDNVSVILTDDMKVVSTIDVKLDSHQNSFIGDTPNAMAIDSTGSTLYVANGLDNALAVIQLGADARLNGSGSTRIKGFIPTEAYPGGIVLRKNMLYVMNLEGQGARVNSKETKLAASKDHGPSGAFNSHKQKATLSFIPVPNDAELKAYTQKVKETNLSFRHEVTRQSPRKNIAPRPMPERIGEPSVFKHVVYIIKENRTYDQVLGDMKEGRGLASLCTFGEQVTPNHHKLARDFVLLDNYYVSGKCSAEGHQWTDAAMVTDYVEKSVRAWFRSYPHVQEDALVYGEKGFIWNNAADHGKTVRIYGEASQPRYENEKEMTWTKIYDDYKAGKPFRFHNTSTISRVRPLLSQNFPGSDDLKITDQIRADAFIKELKEFEAMPGDQFPNLSIMALSVNHTVGTRPGFPTPRAMVADNDLALGRIIEAISKSRFWKETVIFVTEDDSQAGWDHVSAYRTTGFVISPYSRLQKTVSTNYNQTSMVRSIEQILGIPPMNIMDASAGPMFDCFDNRPVLNAYAYVPNNIPLNEMNAPLAGLKGKQLHYAKLSLRSEYDRIDRGDDATMNEILWHYSKGEKPYPKKFAGKDEDD